MRGGLKDSKDTNGLGNGHKVFIFGLYNAKINIVCLKLA